MSELKTFRVVVSRTRKVTDYAHLRVVGEDVEDAMDAALEAASRSVCWDEIASEVVERSIAEVEEE